jgi:hypothetical protein
MLGCFWNVSWIVFVVFVVVLNYSTGILANLRFSSLLVHVHGTQITDRRSLNGCGK